MDSKAHESLASVAATLLLISGTGARMPHNALMHGLRLCHGELGSAHGIHGIHSSHVTHSHPTAHIHAHHLHLHHGRHLWHLVGQCIRIPGLHGEKVLLLLERRLLSLLGRR